MIDNTKLELLQYALNSGKISLADIQEDMNKYQRLEAEKRHDHKISQGNGKDNRWYTYYRKDGELKKLFRSTKDGVLNFLIDYYGIKEAVQTFKDIYEQWFSIKKLEYPSPNSALRQQNLYKRFFAGSEFEKMRVADITEEIIIKFIFTEIKAKDLNKKACTSLINTMNNVLTYARKKKLISENHFEFIDKRKFYRLCKRSIKNVGERVLSDSELAMLYQRLELDYNNSPEKIVPYCVELHTLCGFRLSEGVALKWTDIRGGFIHITKSEKTNKVTGEITIDTTKTGIFRKFPIDKNIQDVLDRVKAAKEKQGFDSEYIFSDKNGRIHSRQIQSYVIRHINRSVTDIRRTVVSRLKCKGVPAVVVADWLGHSPEIDDNYYTYNVLGIDSMLGYVSEMTDEIRKAV